MEALRGIARPDMAPLEMVLREMWLVGRGPMGRVLMVNHRMGKGRGGQLIDRMSDLSAYCWIRRAQIDVEI